MVWESFFEEQEKEDYFKALMSFLDTEYASKTIYPARADIFTAFRLCPYDDVRVVILGQDPYHQPGEAQGLSFSVPRGIKIPPSLRNIYKELNSDLGIPPPAHGSLESWARKGVFLLNSVLTVECDKAGSHGKKGWESFTDNVIAFLSKRQKPMVFILWGAWAQKKEQLIATDRHLTIKSAHPSPLATRKGFFGSKPFSQTNSFLKSQGMDEIDWVID